MRGTSWVLAAGVVAVLAAFVLWRDAQSRVPIGDLEAARPPQHVPLGPVLEASGGGGHRTEPEPGRGRIVGTVRSAGRGVLAEVTCHRLSDPLRPLADLTGDAISTRSGEDGRFALGWVGRGTWQVRARADDGGAADDVVRMWGPAAEERVDLYLGKPVHALTGRIRTDGGAPWGESIAAFPPLVESEYAIPVSEAPVDSEGRFTLSKLPAGKRWYLRMRGSGGIVAFTSSGPTPSSGQLDIVVHVPTGERVVRTLSALGGLPVAGARVRCFWYRHPVFVEAVGFTDAEGRVRLLVAETAGLRVKAAGYCEVSDGLGVGVEEKVVLLRRASRLVGRVTRVSTGEPAPGLTVEVWNKHSAMTDAGGRYALDDVSPGACNVRVHGAGWVSAKFADAQDGGWNPHEVYVPEGVEVTHDLEVEPAGRIEGRVIDAQGAPIAGARVDAYPKDREASVSWWVDGVRSGEDGRYALDGLPPGVVVDLRAVAPTNDALRRDGWAVTAGVQTVDLQVLPGLWIDARVVAADDGKPVPGAEIRITRNDRSAFTLTTDDEGRARVGPMGAGSDLGVSADEFVSTIVEDPTAGEVVVQLSRGLPLGGQVLRPDGTPARSVTVHAESDEGQREVERTDDAGQFAWQGMPAGKWTLTASVDGEPRLGAEVHASTGTTDVVLQLKEGPPPPIENRIRIHVVGPAGGVVQSGHVAVLRAGKSAHAAADDGEILWNLPDVPEDKPFQVVAWGFRDSSGAMLGPAVAGPFRADTREATCTLPSELAIVGRLEGLPAHLQRGVVIRAYPNAAEDVWQRFLNLPLEELASLSVPSEGRLEARCAKDGSFRVGGLGPLPFSLVALLPPGWIQERLVFARPDEGLATVRVRRGASATVTVLDEQGQPVEGANLSLRPDDRGDGPDARVLATAFQNASSLVTDAQGRARLESLRPGMTYDLRVRPKYSREDLLEAEFKDWRPMDLVVRLRGAYVVAGVVRGRDGRPAQDATVALWKDGKSELTSTDEEGKFQFEKLTAGSYPVWAARSHDVLSKEPADAVVVPGGTRNVVLTIDAGVPLVLKLTGGTSAESRQVTLFVREGDKLREVRDEWSVYPEGETLTVHGIEPRTPLVVWLPPEKDDTRYGLLDVSDAAHGPVTMTLQRGATLRVTLDGSKGRLESLDAWSEAGLFLTGEDKQHGRILGCPPGTWRLVAQVADSNSSFWEGTVTVGTEDMDVVLRPR